MPRLSQLVLPFLLLAGCTGPGYFEPIPPSSPDLATLYLFRPKADNPGSQPLRFSYPDVLLDEQSIGTLEFNAHRRVELQPGRHTLRITGLTRQAKWEPHDIEQSFSVAPGEVKYLKLDVRFNMKEMTLITPSYLIHLRPMEPEEAVYEIRTTDLQQP
ncbi:MAG: hypothetical protein ABWY06_01425 [Pseudomonas sp.]|uniref:hypothetical protein n=1 Tax=Pseudomonas sp. TaxID=306 RepID=UPI003392D58B